MCRLCHRLRNGAEWCKHCPKKRVEVRHADGTCTHKDVHTADWGIEGVLIWQVKDLIEEWLADPVIATGILEHMQPTGDSGGRKYRVLDSERGRHWLQVVRVSVSKPVLPDMSQPVLTGIRT